MPCGCRSEGAGAGRLSEGVEGCVRVGFHGFERGPDKVVEAAGGRTQAEGVAEESAICAVLVEVDFLVGKVFDATQATDVADEDQVGFEVAGDQREQEAEPPGRRVERCPKDGAFIVLGRKAVLATVVLGERHDECRREAR